MEYRVTFYRSQDGKIPVVEFLQSMEIENPVLHKLVTSGIRKLKRRENHGRPLTRPLTGSMGILELRVGATDIARVFFFFRPNWEIVCTNAYVKKSQKTDPAEIARAERSKEDWERRYP